MFKIFILPYFHPIVNKFLVDNSNLMCNTEVGFEDIGMLHYEFICKEAK